MEIDTSAAAFSGSAPYQPQLARQGESAHREQREAVERATANPVAAGDDDPARLRGDAPEGRLRDGDGDRPPVARSDASPPAERDTTHGRTVDLSV